MSRIGKKIHELPKGVSAQISGHDLIVKGPKGELGMKIHPRVTIAVNDNKLGVQVANEKDRKDRALWGTFSSIAGNMIKGVSDGFTKELEINGVGYKANMKGDNTLVLSVGFSHQVEYEAPKGIKISVDKNIIKVEGIDRQLVGETAAQIRSVKKPEPYQGKGIRYIDEVVRRKVGKTAAKSAAA